MLNKWLQRRRDRKLKEEIIQHLSTLSGTDRLDAALKYANKYPELGIQTPPVLSMYRSK